MPFGDPYNLFLDDERYPKDVTWVALPPVQWKIVRNYEAFVRAIERYGMPELISFDHDLAYMHYAIGSLDPIPYDLLQEKTGYHCAEWLVQYCLEHDLEVPPFFVHSRSTVGTANIRRVLNPKHVARAREIFKS